VAAVLPAEERDALLAAAYLHDLGYVPSVAETGLHPLAGVRHLTQHVEASLRASAAS
jgi:hypothetical protein